MTKAAYPPSPYDLSRPACTEIFAAGEDELAAARGHDGPAGGRRPHPPGDRTSVLAAMCLGMDDAALADEHGAADAGSDEAHVCALADRARLEGAGLHVDLGREHEAEAQVRPGFASTASGSVRYAGAAACDAAPSVRV